MAAIARVLFRKVPYSNTESDAVMTITSRQTGSVGVLTDCGRTAPSVWHIMATTVICMLPPDCSLWLRNLYV